MPSYAILAEFEARPGKEEDLARFLAGAKAVVDDEPGTLTWYAIRVSQTSFRIFDTFETEEARQAHLDGKVPQAIQAHAGELLAAPPVITPVPLLAAKLPV
ncbi:antibiotic biosynthesis monooxygenase [Streptacidiphilus sp. ASG 303]|uniref:putative quinol monooxygenase n=1 Tax=Streptacidiphilus sp. ASG 303 TaxID=2896847 RepID=UPI001E63AD0C|nr:antibiotic biosynthesis monooxygenase [Streptacidiphilus sp. ASG 303]MCD0483534.1 antibiotic biosynthesis monooxygenase [Streptacidiphilus sp. ASG 303]